MSMALRLLGVLVVVTGVTLGSFVRAEDVPSQLAREYIDQFETLARVEAEVEVLGQMISHLSSEGMASHSTWDEKGPLDAATRREITQLLVGQFDRLGQRVDQYQLESLAAPQRHLRDAWLQVRQRRNRWDQEQVAGADVPVDGRWVLLIGEDTRWLWAAAVFAMAGLAAVFWHDRRHEWRRWLHGANARGYQMPRILGWGAALFSGMMVAAFVAADRLPLYALNAAGHGVTRPIAHMQEEIRELEQRCQAAELRRAEKQTEFQTVRERWSGWQSEPRLREQWKQLERQVRRASVERQVLRQLSGALQHDWQALQQRQPKREEAGTTAVAWDRLRRRVHLTIGLGLSSLTGLLGFALLLTIHRRRERVRRTCPRCLGWDTLQLKRQGKVDGLEVELSELKCSNKLPDGMECKFIIRDSLQGLHKLCFPTFGIRGAGKTLWLTSAYRELKNSKYTALLQHSLIPSSSSDEFDKNVKRVFELGEGLSATQLGTFPDPLLFKFRDRDPIGRSDVLVHVFDFSGEVAAGAGVRIDNKQRVRVLQSDGYLFFFDPTRGWKEQEQAIQDFRHHLKLIGEQKATRSLQTSVALCIGKIEMLAAKTGLPPEFVTQFFENLKQIDQKHPGLNLKALQERSCLAAELWDVLWPDWDIQGLIGDCFGGRHLFFPLTPVSRDLSAGKDPYDLKTRTFDPFGVVEPLVWLIEMNGYPILK